MTKTKEDQISRIIAANVQSVCDWDDRTSPDDYPEHLLITPAELSELLEGVVDAALSVPAAAVVGEPVDGVCQSCGGDKGRYDFDPQGCACTEAGKPLTVDEIEKIIENTEPAEMSDRGDRIWTRRMAVALHKRLAALGGKP